MKKLSLTQILHYAIYAVALTPLVIFSQYISPFHFGKVVLFRSAIEIMAVLYLLLIWREPSYRPRGNMLLWSLLGFTAAFSLTTFTSIDVYQSFWGTLERMGGLWTFWHYVVFYLIITSVLRKREDWDRFLRFTVAVGVLSAFYGFAQRTNISWIIGSGGRSRIFGTIGNPALFAGYQLFNVFIALILALSEKRKNWRNALLIGAGLMTLALFMTAVRGSILGISIGLLAFAFFAFRQTHSRRIFKVLMFLVGLAVVFVLFSVAFRSSSLVKNSPYLTRVTDFSLSNRTVETRVWAWQAGLKGWSESPKKIVLGWGPETFNLPFSEHFNPKFYRGSSSETLFDRAHNMFVEILVTTGVIGLIAYLAIFIAIFISLFRVLKHKPEHRLAASGLIALTIAYIIHNAFIFDTSANFILLFTTLGFINHLSADPITDGERKKVSNNALVTVGAILMVLALVLVYRTNVLQSKQNYATTRGIVRGYAGGVVPALEKFMEAVNYNVPGIFESRDKFAQFLLEYSVDHNMKEPAVIDALKKAIAEEEKSVATRPNDYLPELYLSRLNIILGKDDPKSPYNDEALKHAFRALEMSPTFIRTYYEVAQGYLNKKEVTKALEYFQKAAELNPDTGISYWYWGTTEIQAGNVKRGLELIQMAQDKGYSLDETDTLRLIKIYLDLKDYPKIVELSEHLVSINPNIAQYHASLAVAYAYVGRYDDAVKEAHVAAQVDPSFETDARAFVKSIGKQW